MTDPNTRVLIRDDRAGMWLSFRRPLETLVAWRAEDVRSTIRGVETKCLNEGLFAAGFVCYEAASGFDESLVTHEAGPLPLVWFALFDGFEERDTAAKEPREQPDWVPDTEPDEYQENVDRIRRLIADGETYQVNYTIRLRATCEPASLLHLLSGRNGPYGALIDTDRWSIISGSPELFFTRDGSEVVSKPMKGTRSRGLLLDDDEAQRQSLESSQKDRAENLMITDMVRNDMGRVANHGSVVVDRLFEVEKFLSVWQMTSTVRCQTDASLEAVFGALFPPASITGAPKRHTMDIIRSLEKSPRGIYTGTIGLIRPDGSSQFNVAIRTAYIDKKTNEAVYGVGGGIVWDSDPKEEWAECWHKAEALRKPVPEFRLLETILWDPEQGFRLLYRHLRRLAESARYFDYPIDLAGTEQMLRQCAAELFQPSRIRLTLDPTGRIDVEVQRAPEPAHRPVLVGICPIRVSSSNRFLYHKTTNREVYRRALESCAGCDDAILMNERGEITESTIANVAVQIDGRLCTPPVSCGLLPGTLRAEMLERNELHERVLYADDLRRHPLFLLNSVRGVMAAELA